MCGSKTWQPFNVPLGETEPEVRTLSLLLQRQQFSGKLPGSVFSWASRAEGSRDEGWRHVPDSEERHHKRQWKI